jgi:hypothetical protein
LKTTLAAELMPALAQRILRAGGAKMVYVPRLHCYVTPEDIENGIEGQRGAIGPIRQYFVRIGHPSRRWPRKQAAALAITHAGVRVAPGDLYPDEADAVLAGNGFPIERRA